MHEKSEPNLHAKRPSLDAHGSRGSDGEPKRKHNMVRATTAMKIMRVPKKKEKEKVEPEVVPQTREKIEPIRIPDSNFKMPKVDYSVSSILERFGEERDNVDIIEGLDKSTTEKVEVPNPNMETIYSMLPAHELNDELLLRLEDDFYYSTMNNEEEEDAIKKAQLRSQQLHEEVRRYQKAQIEYQKQRLEGAHIEAGENKQSKPNHRLDALLNTIDVNYRDKIMFFSTFGEKLTADRVEQERVKRLNYLCETLEKCIVYLCSEHTKRKGDSIQDRGERYKDVDMMISRDTLLACLRTLPILSSDRAKRSWMKGTETLFLFELDLNTPFNASSTDHIRALARHYVDMYIQNEKTMDLLAERYKEKLEEEAQEQFEEEKILENMVKGNVVNRDGDRLLLKRLRTTVLEKVLPKMDKLTKWRQVIALEEKNEDLKFKTLRRHFFENLSSLSLTEAHEHQRFIIVHNKRLLYVIVNYLNHCSTNTQELFRLEVEHWKAVTRRMKQILEHKVEDEDLPNEEYLFDDEEPKKSSAIDKAGVRTLIPDLKSKVWPKAFSKASVQIKSIDPGDDFDAQYVDDKAEIPTKKKKRINKSQYRNGLTDLQQVIMERTTIQEKYRKERQKMKQAMEEREKPPVDNDLRIEHSPMKREPPSKLKAKMEMPPDVPFEDDKEEAEHEAKKSYKEKITMFRKRHKEEAGVVSNATENDVVEQAPSPNPLPEHENVQDDQVYVVMVDKNTGKVVDKVSKVLSPPRTASQPNRTSPRDLKRPQSTPIKQWKLNRSLFSRKKNVDSDKVLQDMYNKSEKIKQQQQPTLDSIEDKVEIVKTEHGEDVTGFQVLMMLDKIWDSLLISVSKKIILFNKYNQPPYLDNVKLMSSVYITWQKAANAVVNREKSLVLIKEFEKSASDPRRHFYGKSSMLLQEERQRTILFRRLCTYAKQVEDMAKILQREYNDILYYRNEDYLNKMKYDYSNLLYSLEEDRLKETAYGSKEQAPIDPKFAGSAQLSKSTTTIQIK